MFQVGDRVRQRYQSVTNRRDPRYWNPIGTVESMHGRWIVVKHDAGGTLHRLVGPKFEYLAEEIEHLNPLLRLAENL